MRPSPASSMQKTYDECFLTCSTAVYFESQNNEAEALRSWKAALSQIYHHNAHRVPSNYSPKSETEKALHDSIHQLELQCKERVDLLEALKQSRDEAAQADVNLNPAPTTSYPLPPNHSEERSTSEPNVSGHTGWLGGGTVPPVDYPDIFRPPLPPRPSLQQRRSSGSESNRKRSNKFITRPTLSPDSGSSLRKVSRTPSPEKRGMLKTLRSGGEGPRPSGSKMLPSMRPGPPDAAKAATQAWGGSANSRRGSSRPHSSQNHSTQEPKASFSRTTIRASSERRASQTPIQPPTDHPSPSEQLAANLETLSLKTTRVESPPPPQPPKPGEDRFRGLIKNLPGGIDPAAAEQIIREIVIQGDEVHWVDIAGLDIAKSALKETVVYPFLRPDLFMGLREPAKGMLLFGPPGTGKTMLARAVATESKSTFFAISASSLTSKFLGESEKLVRALFGLAKMLAPSIIFVDEIDSLLSSRAGSGEHEATRRIKTEFLIQWSDLARAAAGREQQDKERGDASRVLVLAATNLPWEIDEAARRRFVRRQYIPLPEASVRKAQLETLLSHQKHSLVEEEIDVLVQLTEGFSGSDITALAKDAAMGPLRSLGERLLSMTMDEIRPIQYDDFKASLTTIRPSVSKQGLKQFEDWAMEFGERGG